MSIYLIKSIMSVVIIFLTIISIYTMFEIFGKSRVTVDVKKYKKIHKFTGYVYITIFMFISYFCLRYIFLSVNICGLLIALITFGIVGSSAGYYLIVSRLGTDVSFDKIAQYEKWAAVQEKGRASQENVMISRPDSIGRGEIHFKAKCAFCHDPFSTKTKVGPGLKGILQNPELPVSRRPATPDSIRNQLIKPFSRMPSFEHLSEKDVDNIIAYLSTL